MRGRCLERRLSRSRFCLPIRLEAWVTLPLTDRLVHPLAPPRSAAQRSIQDSTTDEIRSFRQRIARACRESGVRPRSADPLDAYDVSHGGRPILSNLSNLCFFYHPRSLNVKPHKALVLPAARRLRDEDHQRLGAIELSDVVRRDRFQMHQASTKKRIITPQRSLTEDSDTLLKSAWKVCSPYFFPSTAMS